MQLISVNIHKSNKGQKQGFYLTFSTVLKLNSNQTYGLRRFFLNILTVTGLFTTNLLSYPVSLFLANQTVGGEIYFTKDDYSKRDKYLENEKGRLDYFSQGSPGEKNESIFCSLRVIFLCASLASNLVYDS